MLLRCLLLESASYLLKFVLADVFNPKLFIIPEPFGLKLVMVANSKRLAI